MTREEAIKGLKVLRKDFSGYKPNEEMFDMAITALEQQPCEDCISRQATVRRLCKVADFMNEKREGLGSPYIMAALFIQDNKDEFPPVTPKEKTGHWIKPQQDDGMSDPIYYQVRCSECGFDLDPQAWHMELHQYGADKFCPNCGCHMVEPQESEG